MTSVETLVLAVKMRLLRTARKARYCPCCAVFATADAMDSTLVTEPCGDFRALWQILQRDDASPEGGGVFAIVSDQQGG